jgi:hypothetical protein
MESGRPERRWEDNIKTDLREIGYKDVSDSGMVPLVGSREHSNESLGSIKGWEFLY